MNASVATPDDVARLEAKVADLARARDNHVAIVDILQEISASRHFVRRLLDRYAQSDDHHVAGHAAAEGVRRSTRTARRRRVAGDRRSSEGVIG